MPTRRKKKSKFLRWVLGLVIALVTLMTGCVVVVLTVVQAPTNVANDFMALVVDGEFESAHNSLCLSTRAQVSQEAFIEQFSGVEHVTEYRLKALPWFWGEETTVYGTFKLNDETRPLKLRLTQENDQWRVCNYNPIQQRPEPAPPVTEP